MVLFIVVVDEFALYPSVIEQKQFQEFTPATLARAIVTVEPPVTETPVVPLDASGIADPFTLQTADGVAYVGI
jgi:hypothetical protein